MSECCKPVSVYTHQITLAGSQTQEWHKNLLGIFLQIKHYWAPEACVVEKVLHMQRLQSTEPRMERGTLYLTPLILFMCIIPEKTRHGEICLPMMRLPGDSHVILTVVGKLVIS